MFIHFILCVGFDDLGAVLRREIKVTNILQILIIVLLGDLFKFHLNKCKAFNLFYHHSPKFVTTPVGGSKHTEEMGQSTSYYLIIQNTFTHFFQVNQVKNKVLN